MNEEYYQLIELLAQGSVLAALLAIGSYAGKHAARQVKGFLYEALPPLRRFVDEPTDAAPEAIEAATGISAELVSAIATALLDAAKEASAPDTDAG